MMNRIIVKDWTPYIGHLCNVQHWTGFQPYEKIIVKDVPSPGKVSFLEFPYCNAPIVHDALDYKLITDVGKARMSKY